MTTMKNEAATAVEEARAALAQAEAELADMEALTQDQQLAMDLHEKNCRDEYCGWSFEADNWDGKNHQRYLKQAQEIIAEFPQLTNEDFVKIAQMMR